MHLCMFPCYFKDRTHNSNIIYAMLILNDDTITQEYQDSVHHIHEYPLQCCILYIGTFNFTDSAWSNIIYTQLTKHNWDGSKIPSLVANLPLRRPAPEDREKQRYNI